MHAHFYRLRRAFHLSHWWGRRFLRPLGLTPSRADLLYLVNRDGGSPQRKIQRFLGVTSATVCRMLKSLEELGFVTRHTDPYDGRCRRVNLTEKAWRSVRRIRRAIETGWIEFLVERKVSAHEDRGVRREMMLALDEGLFSAMGGLGDTSFCPYPWSPDG